ncbi:MAG: sigma-70 family RNA polymerase sigma factor [Fimbriimonadaceae bacterium]
MDVDRLINRNKDAVYRQLIRLCGNYADADDVLADSMVVAFKSMSSLQSEDNFRAWLMQIGRRLCWRMKKKQQLMPFLELDERILSSEGPSPDARLFEADLAKCLHYALDQMPSNLREVYVKRDLEQQSIGEIAIELGITAGNVRVRLNRARATVRAIVDAGLSDTLSCNP